MFHCKKNHQCFLLFFIICCYSALFYLSNHNLKISATVNATSHFEMSWAWCSIQRSNWFKWFCLVQFKSINMVCVHICCPFISKSKQIYLRFKNFFLNLDYELQCTSNAQSKANNIFQKQDNQAVDPISSHIQNKHVILYRCQTNKLRKTWTKA